MQHHVSWKSKRNCETFIRTSLNKVLTPLTSSKQFFKLSQHRQTIKARARYSYQRKNSLRPAGIVVHGIIQAPRHSLRSWNYRPKSGITIATTLITNCCQSSATVAGSLSFECACTKIFQWAICGSHSQMRVDGTWQKFTINRRLRSIWRHWLAALHKHSSAFFVAAGKFSGGCNKRLCYVASGSW
jgi:hypothetical protein